MDPKDSEEPIVLQALAATMDNMVRGSIRIVASQVIQTEVRPRDLAYTHRFHQQLLACPHFESFAEGPAIRTLAQELQDRLQRSGRRGGYADLIHVATAIAARATEFWTTDNKIVKWHQESIITEIVICRPYLLQYLLDVDS